MLTGSCKAMLDSNMLKLRFDKEQLMRANVATDPHLLVEEWKL